jgi:hypothetical protein
MSMMVVMVVSDPYTHAYTNPDANADGRSSS